MQQVEDGGYVVAGTDPITWSTSDAYLWKYDSTGNVVWAKTFDIDSAVEGNAVAPSAGNRVVFAGGTGPTYDSLQPYLVKTDAHGGVVSSMVCGPVGRGACSVAETPDGCYVIAGTAHINDRSTTRIFLQKLRP